MQKPSSETLWPLPATITGDQAPTPRGQLFIQRPVSGYAEYFTPAKGLRSSEDIGTSGRRFLLWARPVD